VRRILDRRVYLDANVFIYFLEREPRFFDRVALVMGSAYAGGLVAVTGDAAVAEVMVLPYRKGGPEVVRRFTEFFETRNLFEIRSHGTRDFDDAARLRADIGLPLVDALHLATARRAQCEYFLTNDARIPDIPGLTVIQVNSLRGEEPQ
jgi:predicted nucleic acid-binding protein